MTSYDSTWEAVYRTRATPMKYPYEVVVRFVMRHLAHLGPHHPGHTPSPARSRLRHGQ